jgi:hypothetical protein
MARIFSTPSITTPVIFTPVAPSDLKIIKVESEIRVSWVDNSSYEDGFVVERKQGSGDFDTLFYSKTNRNFFVDAGPFVEDTYTYRVKSFVVLPNQLYFNSPPSNEDSIEMTEEAESETVTTIFIDFNETLSYSSDLKENFRIQIKNSEDIEYLWFIDDDIAVVEQFNDFADVYPSSIGVTKIYVKKIESSDQADFDLTITADSVNMNPDSVINVIGKAINESTVEINWNDISDFRGNVSHYEIYRSSVSESDLVDFNEVDNNRIAAVDNKLSLDILSYKDYGLEQNKKYYYAIVSISRFGKSSLYTGTQEIDLSDSESVTSVRTKSSDVEIDPPKAFVDPDASLYLGIKNNTDGTVTDIAWSFVTNNSGSELRIDEEDFVFYEGSDKWISEDHVRLDADGSEANAKIIVTRVI